MLVRELQYVLLRPHADDDFVENQVEHRRRIRLAAPLGVVEAKAAIRDTRKPATECQRRLHLERVQNIHISRNRLDGRSLGGNLEGVGHFTSADPESGVQECILLDRLQGD